jgi:DNA-binding XRE family transcriptional regulator
MSSVDILCPLLAYVQRSNITVCDIKLGQAAFTVKLAAWRRMKGMTQAALAAELGCSQSYVSQMERPKGWIIPGPDVMGEIHRVTNGAVEPNDFYDLPPGRAEMAA